MGEPVPSSYKDFNDFLSPVEQPTVPDSIASNSPTAKISSPCHFFLEGRCRFGARCQNHHPGDTGGARALEVDRPTHSPSLHQPPGKKPSMKTAEDVISRLLWDVQVPAECFSIGYLDRFLGILEEPFSAFSWEDLASAGPGVLAIPKHRVQYFKYKDRVVWDKASRTDDVFGSTGSKRTILEVIQEEAMKATGEKVCNYNSNGGKARGVAGQGMAKLPGEEVDDSVSTRDTEEWLDKACGGQELVKECGEAEGNTHTILDEDEPRKDSRPVINSVKDGHSIKKGEASKDILIIKGNDLMLEDQEHAASERKKRRPTHFVAIQVTSPDIQATVKVFQGALCEVCPDIAQFCVPLATLHITLCLLCLDSPKEIYKAVTALRELQNNSQRLLPPALLLSFQGVETFHSHVLYMAPASLSDLRSLAQTLEDAFSKKDLAVIHLPGKEKFHLTMVKIPPGKKTPQLPEVASWAPPIVDLGAQVVEALCLCEVGQGRRTDGFYSTLLKLDLY